MNVSIVKARPDDWEKVRALRIRAVKEHPKAFGQTLVEASETTETQWRERFDRDGYILAKRGDEFVGMACYVQEKGEKLRHVAFVYSMYVAPEVRRQGVGRALLDGLISDIKVKHSEIVKLQINVSVAQPEAHALYKSVGFEDVGILEKELKVDGEFIDEYTMAMMLDV